MKLQELRVGNVIKSLSPGIDYCFVVEISEKKVIGSYTSGRGGFLSSWFKGSSNIEGVRLTEEWLIKLGFDKNHNSYSSPKLDPQKFQLTFKFDPTHSKIIRHSPNFFIDTDIEFVHQLQNLHFAVIGLELSVD